jgi:hypothetical protein
VLGVWEVGRYNFYAWAVAGVVLWMVVGAGGRAGADDTRRPASSQMGEG